MIRQAHTYLVSAMSGATLIAIAIVAFVLLVSAQVFRDFPLAGLGGGDGGQPHISDARAASAPAVDAARLSPAAASAQQRSTGSGAGGKRGDAANPTTSDGTLATTGAPAVPSEPAGGEGGAPSGGNQAGSEGTPSSPTGSAPGSNQGSSSSSGNSGGSSSGGSSTASTPTGKLTETVNGTVNQVDETVTGGAIGETGVTGVTEGVVNGVAGPESPVGKVVDETVKTVGGLLGANR